VDIHQLLYKLPVLNLLSKTIHLIVSSKHFNHADLYCIGYHCLTV